MTNEELQELIENTYLKEGRPFSSRDIKKHFGVETKQSSTFMSSFFVLDEFKKFNYTRSFFKAQNGNYHFLYHPVDYDFSKISDSLLTEGD